MISHDEMMGIVATEAAEAAAGSTPRSCSVDHVRQSMIVCPHCGYKYMESWEFDDVGEAKCCQCGKCFSHYRDVIYTTEPLND